MKERFRSQLRNILIKLQVEEEFNKRLLVSRKLRTYDIEQNLFSFSLLFKSIFYTNSSLVYLISFFNCFQTLSCSDENDTYPYSGYTHAMTVFIMKRLQKAGLLAIAECHKKDKKLDLKYYYEAMGNNQKHEKIQMYDITFYKIRSFAESDIPLIKEIAKVLKANSEEIVFKCVDGKVFLGVKKTTYLKNITSLHVLKQIWAEIARTIERYKIDSEDIEDIKAMIFKRR